MKNWKKYLLVVAVSLLAIVASFFFEENYRHLVRYLYRFFTNGDLSFAGKNFHLFPSWSFMLAFAAFCVLLTIRMLIRPRWKNATMALIAVLIFFSATGVICWWNSHTEIIMCTACKNGKKVLYHGTNYDTIFITSLAFAVIPVILSLIKAYKHGQYRAN
jgi:hypothetical protein